MINRRRLVARGTPTKVSATAGLWASEKVIRPASQMAVMGADIWGGSMSLPSIAAFRTDRGQRICLRKFLRGHRPLLRRQER